MQRSMVAAAVLGALVAGCLGPGTTYELAGTFTENATQQQMEELGAKVRDRRGTFAQLESFPVQFRAADLARSDCQAVRSFALNATYVADVGRCSAQTSGGYG